MLRSGADEGRSPQVSSYFPGAGGSLHLLHLRGTNDDGDGFYQYTPRGKRSDCAAEYIPSDITGRLTYYTSDSTFLKVEIVTTPSGDWWNQIWNLYFPDGRRVTGTSDTADTLYNANGNAIHFANACADPPVNPPTCNMPYTVVSDDFNREVRIDTNVNNATLGVDTQKQDRITAPSAT